MTHSPSRHRAALVLLHRRAAHRFCHPGTVTIRRAEVPTRGGAILRPSPALLTTPPGLLGWVILAPGEEAEAAGRLAATLHGVGLGTLRPLGASEAGAARAALQTGAEPSLEARAERLLAAARWLREQPEARAGSAGPVVGLAGLGADAAGALAAAAGELRFAAVVGIAGRYAGLEAASVAGLRAPLRLIAARDDAGGLAEARQVLAWLPGAARGELALVAGTGGGLTGTPGGLTAAGWRDARWLGGAWLVEQVARAAWTPEAALAARRRLARRMSLAGLVLALGPLGVLAPLRLLGESPGEARAAGRLWAGSGAGLHSGGPLPVLKLDAPLPGTIELSSLNGTNGFRANGVATADFSGWAVSDVGDVNGDGLGDILVAAFFAGPNGSSSGQSYVVYGGSAVPATVELSALNGTNGFRMNGVSTSDVSGISVSGAGDVNMDGFDDILIGADRADPNGSASGQSYVVYGGTAVPATVELSTLNGTNGFRLNGVSTSDRSGAAVSGAGDVNGDGLDDILIGAYGADPNGGFSGQGYVVYGGSAVPAAVELSALNGTNGFRVNGVLTGDASGVAVSGAGDVNGDGFDDILIGARTADPNGSASGQSYVVYGGSAVPTAVELSALNGTSGFRVNGVSTSDFSGSAVSAAGDVNMDGLGDILIGAYLADPNGDHSGQSYVVYGGSTVPATVELSALNGTNGFRANGISTSDRSGRAVSGAGDVNGDGFDDLLIGTRYADPNGDSSGQSYLVYGGSAVPATVELSALNGTNGLRVNGVSTDDRSGGAVSGAGDVNGDGFGDLLVAALLADPNGSQSGQSYVIYGDGKLVPTPPPAATLVAPTAVELRSFRAAGLGDHVVLAWETETEAEVLGFNVYRSAEGGEQGLRVNRALIPATGGAVEGAAYRLRDLPPAAGSYFYRLEVVNRSGAPEVYGPIPLRWEGLRLFLPAAARSAEVSASADHSARDAAAAAPDASGSGLFARWVAWLRGPR